MIHDYATGRKLQPPERIIFSGAARDPKVALMFDAFGTRQIGATKLIAVGTPLAVLANARYALRHGGRVGHVGTGVGSAA